MICTLLHAVEAYGWWMLGAALGVTPLLLVCAWRKWL